MVTPTSFSVNLSGHREATVTRLLQVVVILLTTCTARPAQAHWFRTESIEWHTNVSDVIVVAEVVGVKEVASDNKYDRVQTVTCKPTDVLKGKFRENVTIWQFYSRNKQVHGKDNLAGDRPIVFGDRVLLFLVPPIVPPVDVEDRGRGLVFWVNLTKPDSRR